MRTGSIYIIRNKINNKVYIGQTTMSVEERFKCHLKPSTIKKRKTYKLYNAINKYGADNFYVETLESNIPLSELNVKEMNYILKYDSYKNGYNSTMGGDGRTINKLNNESELLYLAKSDVDAKTLAALYKVNKATIFRTLHKLGFYYYKNEPEILKLFELGLTNKDIANKLNCNIATVSRVLLKHNKRQRRIPINKRTDFDYNGLFKDYNNQMPIKDICEKYDIAETTFRRIQEKFGIKNRT